MRYSALPREKATIIIFRKYGQNIQNIAKALGRSTSFVQAVLKKAESLGVIVRKDNRKIPSLIKRLRSRIKLASCFSWMRRYELFLLGAEEEPP